VVIGSPDSSITESVIRNVRHGVEANADGVRVADNLIEFFTGDGIRGLGDDSVYVGNTIRTCIKADDNHDDGFQSWSVDAQGRPGQGVVRNVRVENNIIENGDHPLRCALQGIGLFGGFYEDWVIRGNRIIANHWHGVTVMGARRVEVSDNIVVDSHPGAPGPPWITITAHKDGTLSEDNVIAGNVSQPWSGGSRHTLFSQPQPGVQLRNNRVVASPEEALSLAR
jgi:hypothetical protein